MGAGMMKQGLDKMHVSFSHKKIMHALDTFHVTNNGNRNLKPKSRTSKVREVETFLSPTQESLLHHDYLCLTFHYLIDWLKQMQACIFPLKLLVYISDY